MWTGSRRALEPPQQVQPVQVHRQPPKASRRAQRLQPRPGQVWQQAQPVQVPQRAMLPVSAVDLTTSFGEQRWRQRVHWQSPQAYRPRVQLRQAQRQVPLE
jgi:hypothetical protein